MLEQSQQGLSPPTRWPTQAESSVSFVSSLNDLQTLCDAQGGANEE